MPDIHRVWGDTCPILNISRYYGYDYGDCLLVADYYTNGRHSITKELQDRASTDRKWVECIQELYLYAERFTALRSGKAQ